MGNINYGFSRFFGIEGHAEEANTEKQVDFERQITTIERRTITYDGEYCGKCDNKARHDNYCKLFEKKLREKVDNSFSNYIRCSDCKKAVKKLEAKNGN